jgi:hypothetical protein
MALGRLKRREFSRTIGSQLVLGCLFGGATYSHNTIAAKWFPIAESFIHKNLSDKCKERVRPVAVEADYGLKLACAKSSNVTLPTL